MNPRLMIIAGEVSGDIHAAGLVRALQRRTPGVSCFGVGGDMLRAAGMETIYDVRQTAALGFAEILPKLLFFKEMFDRMLALLAERRPDAVILVDYPGFNLRFAAHAHAMGFKVIYYICPQVWAWHESRIARMAKTIHRLLVIFPFEAGLFAGTGLKVDYVGHPLIDEARLALGQEMPNLPWRGNPHIALLPGSRKQVIRRMFPLFWEAAGLLQTAFPDAGFIVASATDETATFVSQLAASLANGPSRCAVVAGHTRQILRSATAAMVASGTATLETALMGCPMIVSYKISPFTFFFLKRFVTVKHIGMVNIVAGREICGEFVQNAATPEAIAQALTPLLRESPERAAMIAGFGQVSERLGPGGASDRAAAIVLEELAALRNPQ